MVQQLDHTGDAILAETAAAELAPEEDRSRLSRPRVALYRLLGAALIVGLWELLAHSGLIERAFLPAPERVAQSLGDLARGGLGGHIWTTLSEALLGFAIGTVVGVVVGVVLGIMPRVNETVAPFLAMMNATPRIALAPLFVLWFGIGSMSHILLVFSLVVFIVLSNAIAGAQAVEKDHLVLARLLGATRSKTIRKIIIPSIVPWIFAAMRVSWAYALAGAVVGEMFLGQKGLGYLINAGSGLFNIAQIFAALVITVALAWLVDGAIRLAERWFLRWRPSGVTGA